MPNQRALEHLLLSLLVVNFDAQAAEYYGKIRTQLERRGTPIGSVDYLIAKNNLDRAKTNLIVARYEYLLRIKILDYYQAKPLW